jgi:LuxR family transcriptional regulator, maltose regulon positive regulatory protein
MTTAVVTESPKPSVRMWSTRPERRGSIVRRSALVRELADPAAPPLVVLVAPAGYGKTTLLREWASRDPRPFAWVTVDERDNDGDRLRESVEEALAEAVRGDRDPQFVLVIDDAHALHSRSGLDALAEVADALPLSARLAVASRRQLALPVARMRVQRLVTEIGPRDLAMTRAEAAKLLAESGQRLDSDTLDALLQRTEGWPAALALAALYVGDGANRANLARFGGSERLVADYVRDELLSDLPDDVRSFAVRTCVVDTLTGSLCDALLDRGDSAAVLGALARDGLAIAVDRTGERYRYHRLMRDVLRAELRRLGPELEPELHRRASGWHRSTGDVDGAVLHALAARDVRVAGDMVWRGVAAEVAAGRGAVVERWLNMFDECQIARQPRLALTAAGCELARGQGHLAGHWAAVAADAPQPAGSRGTVEAGVTLMRAAVAADGTVRMRDDARRARDLLQPGSGACHALACLLEGVAALLLGERAEAARRLEEGARHAAVLAPHVRAVCLAELAALALDRADWDDMTELAARARSQADRPGLRNLPTSAVVFAMSAVARAHRGRIEEAWDDLRHAARQQVMLTDFAPWYGMQVHLLLARAALRLSDVRLARRHVDEAARILRRLPEAVALADSLGEARALLETFAPPESARPVPMTAAELRVLRFLPTHLSFREIAERTQVSANTVKTQANAVYRKFGVACRSDAVARARTCGLLD